MVEWGWRVASGPCSFQAMRPVCLFFPSGKDPSWAEAVTLSSLGLPGAVSLFHRVPFVATEDLQTCHSWSLSSFPWSVLSVFQPVVS